MRKRRLRTPPPPPPPELRLAPGTGWMLVRSGTTGCVGAGTKTASSRQCWRARASVLSWPRPWPWRSLGPGRSLAARRARSPPPPPWEHCASPIFQKVVVCCQGPRVALAVSRCQVCCSPCCYAYYLVACCQGLRVALRLWQCHVTNVLQPNVGCPLRSVTLPMCCSRMLHARCASFVREQLYRYGKTCTRS